MSAPKVKPASPRRKVLDVDLEPVPAAPERFAKVFFEVFVVVIVDID
jgi:hypothetical protein